MNQNKNKPNKPIKNAVVLTGIAFQMGITIYLFVMLGKWLDSKYTSGGKLFLIIATLLGVGVSLYVVVKQLDKFNNS